MLPKHLVHLHPGGVFKVTGLLVPGLPYLETLSDCEGHTQASVG